MTLFDITGNPQQSWPKLFTVDSTDLFCSHFLVVGKEWDEPIELIEIVGGGRLSTGVKKSWLVGGEQPKEDGIGEGTARAFCFEWAAM